jgi:hypothetical protein
MDRAAAKFAKFVSLIGAFNHSVPQLRSGKNALVRAVLGFLTPQKPTRAHAWCVNE